MVITCVSFLTGGLGDSHLPLHHSFDPAGEGGHPPWSLEGSSLLFETQLAETPRDGGKIMRKAVCICLSILTEASPRTIGTTKIWVQWLSLQGCFKLEKSMKSTLEATALVYASMIGNHICLHLVCGHPYREL